MSYERLFSQTNRRNGQIQVWFVEEAEQSKWELNKVL